MKKILICLDYDPTAEMVAKTAHTLFKETNAVFILLHVVANEVYYASRAYSPIMGFVGFVPSEPIEGQQAEYLLKAAEDYLMKTKSYLGDMNISILAKEGDFSDTIIETVNEIKADLVVVGSSERKWLEKVVSGSVTEQVLRSSKVPVLVIPTDKHDMDK